MLVITVRLRVKPEYEQRFLDRVKRQAKDSLAGEIGCKQFDVCQAQGKSGHVFLYEVYADDAAFEVHLRSEYLKSFNADVADWVEEKVLDRWVRT